MVAFGSGYYMPMEREFDHHDHGHGFAPSQEKATNDAGVSIGDLGMSLAMGPVPNVQALGARLRGGTKTLEIGFFGMGKGSGQGHTPEMYGVKQRKALEEIGKANKVDFTTHTTVGVYGLAGMDRQGNFSKADKNFSLQEIKRAIEFASDVAAGGPVVVHTGEFQRPVVDAEWNERSNDPYYKKFRMFEDEEGRTSFRVVDVRTGGVIQEARKNRYVARPKWNVYDHQNEDIWKEMKGKEYEDAKGNVVRPGDYIDYFGNKLKMAERVPRFDKENQRFVIEQLHWNDLVEEAKKMSVEAKEEWAKWKEGKLNEQDAQRSKWRRFFNERFIEQEIEVRPEEAYIISTLETNAANSRGWAIYYGGNFEEYVDNIKRLEKAKEFYEKLESEVDPQEKWKLLQQARGLAQGLVPLDAQYPTNIIEDQIKELRRHLEQAREASSSQWAQAEEAEETMRNVESAETYALREAYDAYALAAMNALKHTEKLGKDGKLKKPLAIALENLFPETYGSHPDELIKLVKNSRDRMAQMLVKERNMSEGQATQVARQHITATFDTGHLNMWRKYWVPDDKKSIEENDKEFNKWMLNKIGEMVDKDIIGHVHIDDNQGYQDEHLAPGEGNTPIKEMIELLKKKGYNGELIIEPGADYYTDISGFHSVMKTWRYLGQPVYGKGSGLEPQRRTWNQVGYGYFSQLAPPYFVFGAYSPSEDWTLWSGVPLE